MFALKLSLHMAYICTLLLNLAISFHFALETERTFTHRITQVDPKTCTKKTIQIKNAIVGWKYQLTFPSGSTGGEK